MDNFTQFQHTMNRQMQGILGTNPTQAQLSLWNAAYFCGYNTGVAGGVSTTTQNLATTRVRGDVAGTTAGTIREPSPTTLAGKALAQIRAVPGITNAQLASVLNQKSRAFTTIFGKQKSSLVSKGLVTGSPNLGWHAATGAATPMQQQRAA